MNSSSQDLISNARKALGAGAYRDVVALAAAAAPGFLANDEAALCLALAHIHLGELASAEPMLRAIVARSPRAFEAKATLCKLLIVDQREGEAANLFPSLENDAKDDARAMHLLGDAYLQARRVSDAHRVFLNLKQMTRAPAAEIGLAETSLRMGRADEAAIAAARAASALGLQPVVLQVLGPAALCGGDAEMLARCLRAVEALPRPVAIAMLDSWTDLLVAADRLPEASFACQKAADFAESPERLRLLSDLSLSALDLEGATKAAERARLLSPRDAQSALMLARCRIVEGDVAAALVLLHEALSADPDCVGAYDYLSQIKPKQIDAGMRGRMAALVEQPARLRAGDRPRLRLAMGRLAEAGGDHAGAFSHYVAAKSEIARAATAAGRGYDPVATEAGLRRLISAFPTPIGQSGAVPTARMAPIFIVGMPRSGTSLIEQVLSSHPAVYGAGELPTMVQIGETFVRQLEAGGQAQAIIDANAAAWCERYIKGVPDGAAGHDRITDKHPLNFWTIGLIAALFPDARFIHISRDPLDTCLSIFKQRFHQGYTMANDFEALAHYYVAYERVMAHWRSIFPAIQEVRYEAFVSAFEPSARGLVAACGLAWSDSCLEFHQARRPVFTHSAAQVRAPVGVEAVERWRKFGESIKPLAEALERHRAR